MRLTRDGEALYVCTPLEAYTETGGFGDTYSDGAGNVYQHRGVDQAPKVSRSPVRAPAAGVVVDFYNSWVEFNGQQVRSFGNAVCIDHQVGKYRFTLLAHNSVAYPNVGDTVEAGQVVGLSGATGVAYGEHVHWQRCSSSWFPVDITLSVDPRAYMATEEEIMEPYRLLLMRAADAPFTDMVGAFEALKPQGFFDPWISRDGEPGPIDQKDDGWDAQARRSCLRWLATTDRAEEAVKALGWAA